jgi:Peptidase family M23
MRLTLAVAVIALVFADPAIAGWRPPVRGEVARVFDPGRPFEAGRHRGVDLAAPPGTEVRAPCAGEVAFAGPVAAAGRVVTLRCGTWRVTHLPLAATAVRAGAAVEPGALLGTVAATPGHAGLHLGVRREGTRFGYVDPLRFLATRRAPPPLGPAPRPVRPPRAAPPSLRAPVPADSNRGLHTPFAPWPAWLGLALVLAGAGFRLRGRRPGGRGRVVAAGTLTR